MVLGTSAVAPSLAYGVTGPTSWPFTCIKPWDGTSVHLVNVVLPVNNLTCFSILIFLSATLLHMAYKGDGTSIQCHVFLLFSLVYHVIYMWNVTLSPQSLYIWWGHSYLLLGFSNPLTVEALFAWQQGKLGLGLLQCPYKPRHICYSLLRGKRLT